MSKTATATRHATTAPRPTPEALKRENAGGGTLGAFSAVSREIVLEVRNRNWTHIRIEGRDFLLTEAQAAVVKVMADLVSADEFIANGRELCRMAETGGRPLSQIFRGSPLAGKLFKYLRQPRGYVEIMLSGVISCI